MTIEELYTMLLGQQAQINQLQSSIRVLRELSDTNDQDLREMIDALTDSVDSIMDDHCCCEKYKRMHEINKANKKLERENI